MNFGIRSILAPSSISSAVVARMFTPNGDDVLAISKGNLLYFYLINEKMEDNTVYECEKQIHMLIPIHHPYASYSNILVIFTNFQAKVINFSGETVQEFSLVPNPSKSLFAHLKYALHPNYLVLQLSPKHLEIYSISGNCTLKSLPYPVSIPCKAILDFTFVGPVFKVTDLVILTSEFADIKKLRYISLGSLGFTVDEVKEVQLPSDTYKIISLLPEKVSMIISFASKVATRIDYEKDIKPHLLTATIFTPSRIKNFDCIEENVYLYIDENGHYGTVRLENEGTIQFVKVGQIHDLLVILSLNHSLAFVGSTTGDSYLMENFHKIKTFKATGPPKKVTNIGNSLYLLCEHSTVKIQKKIPLKIQREILADDALSLFSFGDHILVSTKNKTEEINTEGTLIPNSLFNIEDKTVYFGVLQNGSTVHVSQSKFFISPEFYLDGVFHLAASNGEIIVVVTNDEIIFLDIFGNKIRSFISRNIINITIDKDHLAISKNDEIIIYSLEPFTLVKRILGVSPIDIIFSFDYLLSLERKDAIYAYSLSNNEEHKINHKGFHTKFCSCDEDVLICGQFPALLSNIKSIQYLDCEPFIDALFVSSSLFYLTFHSIKEAFFSPSEFHSKMLLGVSSIVETDNDNWFYTIDNYLYFSRKNKFDQSKMILQTDTKLFIEKCGLFYYAFSDANIYVYDQYCNLIRTFEINNFHKSISFNNNLYLITENDVINIETKQTLLKSEKIKILDMNTSFAAVIDRSNTLNLYTFHQNENVFKLNSISTLFDNISAISIYLNFVFSGTMEGKLLIFEIVPDCNLTTFNINYFQQITLDKPVTMVQTCKNCVLVGLDSGQLYQIQKIRTDNGFIEAYNEALSNDNATKETNIYDLDKFSEFCINISDQANLKLLFSALKE